MSFKDTGDEIRLRLEGRIDSGNAQQAEDEILAALEGSECTELILDAEALEYLSSAGLRMLLRLKKGRPGLTIENVSSEVYEILEMTGFTEIIDVKRAYRTISVEGCEQIGCGANGAVYRTDNETVVKVYNDPDSLNEIRHEREMAKTALVLGLPTAISYEIVKVGDGYGSVFELLNASSFSNILEKQPESFDRCVKEYAALLRKIHSVSAPEGKLPSFKETAYGWAKDACGFLPESEGEKLCGLIAAVPESAGLLHGDYHTKNIMLQGDEVLLIDMDTLATGDPIFEFATIYCAFIGFYETDREAIKAFQGFDFDTGERFFNEALAEYLGTSCPHKLREVKNKARIISYARLISRSIRHGLVSTEKGLAEAEHWREELIGLLEEYDSLTFDECLLTLPARRENLDEALRFIEEHTAVLSPDKKALKQLLIASEEIFVNVCDYAYASGTGYAAIRVSADPALREAELVFEDGGTPFDPEKAPDPNVALSADEREPGGLGVFLARKLTDSMAYERRDGTNVLTIKKRL